MRVPSAPVSITAATAAEKVWPPGLLRPMSSTGIGGSKDHRSYSWVWMISAIFDPRRANVDGLFDLRAHLADQHRLAWIGCLDTIKQRQLINIMIDQSPFADGCEFAGNGSDQFRMQLSKGIGFLFYGPAGFGS